MPVSTYSPEIIPATDQAYGYIPPSEEVNDYEQRLQPAEMEPISVQDRLLTEIDHLAEHRLPDGSYPDWVLRDIKQNLRTAVKEAAIPHAVPTVVHECDASPNQRQRIIKWMGKTAVEAATSGYLFHKHHEARARVAIEVDEARFAQEDLQPGYMKFFISPRMTRADATLTEAKEEHLAHDDAVRASWLVEDENGKVVKHAFQSLLVADVPLYAWNDLLKDPENAFGKSIEVRNRESATAIMEVHRELVVPLGEMPEGPISMVVAVVPYIHDTEVRQSVEHQIALFRSDQAVIRSKADNIAERWIRFEMDQVQSLDIGYANTEIRDFIESLSEQWNIKDTAIISDHRDARGQYRMTRDLAKILENAKRNLLWTAAAVMADNQKVVRQISPKALQDIRHVNSMYMQRAAYTEHQIYNLQLAENGNNSVIAEQHVKVGGGCAGSSNPDFLKNNNDPQNVYEGANSERTGYGRSGRSRNRKNMSCPHCKAKVFDDPCAKDLSCNDCHARVLNGRTVSKGNGGKKARERLARDRKREADAKKARDNFLGRAAVSRRRQNDHDQAKIPKPKTHLPKTD